jgi:hypothetical protein
MPKKTQGLWAKRIVYYLGGIVLIVEVVVIVAVAILTAESNREILEKVIPARFLTPWLLLVYMLAGLMLIKYGGGAYADTAPSERGVHPDETSPNLRERVRLLSAQVSNFHHGRIEATPSALSLPMLPATPHEWNEASQKTKLYGHETSDLYLQRFAPQITLILKELAREGVVDAELNAAYLLNSNLLIGIAEVAERLNTLADQLPLSEATTPDVAMTVTFPGMLFLCASGRACEIRIGPIILESAVTGTHTDNGRTMREVSEHYAIEFPVVGDIGVGEKTLVIPTLFCGKGYSRSTWPEKESGQTGMAEFFRMAAYVRHVTIGEPDVNTCTDAEVDDFAKRIREELTFSFDITFWNSERTQQWKRSEQLVYEPMTGAAFVRHARRPEPLVRSAGVRP